VGTINTNHPRETAPSFLESLISDYEIIYNPPLPDVPEDEVLQALGEADQKLIRSPEQKESLVESRAGREVVEELSCGLRWDDSRWFSSADVYRAHVESSASSMCCLMKAY
jgi:hypothetical protein